MLRAIGFLLFSLGYILTIKKTYENYKNEKILENLMELIGRVFIIIGTSILAIAYIFDLGVAYVDVISYFITCKYYFCND